MSNGKEKRVVFVGEGYEESADEAIMNIIEFANDRKITIKPTTKEDVEELGTEEAFGVPEDELEDWEDSLYLYVTVTAYN